MKELISKIIEETNAQANPYFLSLRQGELNKQDFVETQIQFCHAVEYFVRPMCALAAKIPFAELRVEIIRNVWEEHGEGDSHRFHGTTFREFLFRLDGVTAADIRQRALSPSVRAFNAALLGACALDEYLIGAATLGIIERMFCDISLWIALGVVENGWMTADQMTHYTLHKDLDIKHADDFFDVLLPAWNRSDEDRYFIEQGLRMGATLFNGLYENLYRERKRRQLRNVSGPHVRA